MAGSSARYVSGYYDERAVDLFFNEVKVGDDGQRCWRYSGAVLGESQGSGYPATGVSGIPTAFEDLDQAAIWFAQQSAR